MRRPASRVRRRIAEDSSRRAARRRRAITCWLFEADSEADSELIVGEVYELNPTNGAASQKGPDKTSGASDTYASIGWSGSDADFPLVIADDRLYAVAISLPTTSGDLEARVIGLKVVYDHP